MRLPSLLHPYVRVLLAGAMTATLMACGSGGGSDDDDDDDDMTEAFAVVGQANFTSNAANSGGVAAATLSQPIGAAAVGSNILFVADTANNRVLAYNPVPAASGKSAAFALGQPDLTTVSAGTSASKMALPVGVAVGDGRLLVIDSGNNRILVWNSVPTSGGIAPDLVLGQSDFTSASSGLSASTLSYPTAAALAGNRLVVADQGNNRVLVWTSVPTANGQAADLVLGQASFVTKDNGDEAYEMNRPSSVWTDGFRLLVADSSNNRILYWQLFPGDNAAAADFVIGQSDFNRSNAGTGSTGLKTPYGVGSDGGGIYIADSGNNRVLKYDSFPLANAAAANDVYGQSDFSNTSANDDDQDGEIDDDPSDRTLNGPTAAVVADGVLYVSDRNNNRVMLFPQ